MSADRTHALIASLAATAEPVRPLAPPLRRGLGALLLLVVVAVPVVIWLGDIEGLVARYLGREALMWAEMGAMLATGVLGVIGAFFVSIPGRSRLWLAAPLPSLAAWIALSGLGCYLDLARRGTAGWELGESMHCLSFLLGAGALIAAPSVWLLARAKPVDPLPVALLGGLGVAGFSAFLLQFFHPFAVTLVDLAAHLGAAAAIVGLVALLRRPLLRPA